MTDDPTLRQALAYARRGWPVFPCLPGQKVPATRHGYRDATTDEQQITGWFARHPDRTWPSPPAPPAPTSWTSTSTAPPGTGTPPSAGSTAPGCSTARTAYVRTPSGGLHVYFTGTAQRNGHLPAHHLDFRSAGGYVLAPPSQVDGHPYLLVGNPRPPRHPGLGPPSAALLPSQPQRHRPGPRPAPDRDLDTLARWVARQPEGNRNAGLYWAANRALETDPAADLSPLADAARQAGLGDPEITRTLDSARRTGQARPEPPDHQAEAVN